MSTSFVTLFVTHSDLEHFRTEKNFELSVTIADLKKKLESLVGTQPQFQKIELQDPSGSTTPLEDESKTLSDYSPSHHQVLHVIDQDPNKYVASTQQADGPIEPFVLSADKEAARAEALKAAKEAKALADDQRSLKVKVGDRCQVVGPQGEAPRVGEVAYIGTVHWAAGLWVGVKFDSPVGKNDGSGKGVRYFTCEPNHGSFVKPATVLPLLSHTSSNHCCPNC